MINSIAADWFVNIFLVLLSVCCFSLIFSVLSFAPWVPSRHRDLRRIFRLAGLKPGQTFYDLGCGDGRTVVYAAKHFKAKAIGLEICLPLYLICRLRQLFNYKAKINFKFKNLYKENLSQADAIYFFGMPGKLIKQDFVYKLKSELKPGARIISYSFKLADWSPVAVDRPSEKDLPIYLYEA